MERQLTLEEIDELIDIQEQLTYTQYEYDGLKDGNEITITREELDVIPQWCYDILPDVFDIRHIVFLKNKGDVYCHSDGRASGRECVITFPLNYVEDSPTIWYADENGQQEVDRLYHRGEAYLTNVYEWHGIEPYHSYRYFMQICINGKWENIVPQMLDLGLIGGA
jgi:hypothetical protein